MTRAGSLGLLVDWIDDEYQSRIIGATDEVAQKYDRHLLCFAGGPLSADAAPSSGRSFIYDLVTKDQIDGLVTLSGTLSNLVGPAGLAGFLSRFRALPMCSVGVAVAGVPSVLVDNARGMRALLLHLIDVHGFERLAFIRGPEASEEAESRFAVYRDVLGERGIALDPNLITEGNFRHASGNEAVRYLLDERHVAFDAVVAANDLMAFGAIEALGARGLRVPYDVAVVGFDDVQAARYSSPPLTTVRQPLRDQGLIAAEHVIATLRNDPPPSGTVLRTQLVVRQSCGCAPVVAPSVAQFRLLPFSRNLRETLHQHRARITSDLAQAMRAVGATFELGWGDRLLEALEAELGTAHPGVFLAVLEELLETAAVLGANVGAWHGVVNLLRHHSRGASEFDPPGFVRSEDLWHDARILVSSVAERAHARARLRTEHWVRRLRSLGEHVHATPNVAARGELLGRTLPELGLRSGYLVLLEGWPASNAVGRLLTAFDSFGSGHLPRPGSRFSATELVPGGLGRLPRRTSYVVEPLLAGDQPFGYALLELGGVDNALHETVRREVSRALEPKSGNGGHQVPAVLDLKSCLVPARLSVEGFRAATFASTQGSAASDYCDVLPIEGGIWVGLGQVLPTAAYASAVALMIQSAVVALVGKNPTILPRELLGALNAALYENLKRRLKSETCAALLLIRCDAGGRVVFAGTGASLWICRSRDGRAVALDTAGTTIGVVHDVSRSVEDIHCQLEPGDVLLAHTTTLSQAKNAQGEAFGNGRLSAELERARSYPVDELRDHLVLTVTNWLGGEAPPASLVVVRHGWEPPTRSRPNATS